MTESEKASENLKNFTKIVRKLISEEKINFNLLVGGGDSGMAMLKITEMIFEELGIMPPMKLALPFFRFSEKHIPHGDEFDNSSLIDEIRSAVSDSNFKNVLFVDDEINRARNLNGIIDLIRRSNPDAFDSYTNIYIVAENRGFTTDLVSGINIKFVPFGEKTEGLNNVILKIVPSELNEKIQRYYGELYPAELTCVLLNLPIKKLREGRPAWTNDLLNDVKSKVPNFKDYQKEFDDYLRNFIKENI